jgi:acyl-coenzyme A synthetase/AMP-(fatty) acid ligase
MQQHERRSLRDLTAFGGLPQGRFLSDAAGRAKLADLRLGSSVGAALRCLHGRTIIVSSGRQLPAALALIELDGVAGRMLLCPPDLAPEHLAGIMAEAQVDAIVTDGTGPASSLTAGVPVIACHGDCDRPAPVLKRDQETEWLLFTSGTTGRPKLAVHTLSSLIGPLADGPVAVTDAVWGTFYDIRRYGGLQVLLRALLGGSSLVLSHAGETVRDFLERLRATGATHILGTPSHWRRALMSPALSRLSPRYVRVSGETADQAILTQLALAFPKAGLTHAYASTEAGVGFEVTDGREGFPASFVDGGGNKRRGIEIRVVDGSIRMRSSRGASRYLGDRGVLADADGFIDTGDMVTRRADRYYFMGRREGVVNVGGHKVHPEEVEAIISRHPGVRMARVRGRPNPITGAIVVADIVVRQPGGGASFAGMQQEILASCRAALPPYKVPALLQEVPFLEIGESGKLVRSGA